jgi:iron complex outermembrane recepter protein
MKQSNTNFGTRLLIPNASVADFGIFGTTNLQWNKSALQAGLRFDSRNIATETHNQASEPNYFAGINKSYTSFNASIGYKINWNEKNSLRLNLASGFRAPNLAELTSNGVHEGTNRFEIGNANLKTEQNQQIDLNFEYKDSHFEFFSNAFYNNINNYIFTNPTGLQQDNVPVYEYVQSNSKLFGGEIGFHLHPHPLDWLHFESSFSTVTGQKQDNTFLPFIPANQWNNVFRTEFKSNNWLKDGFATLKIATFFSQNKVAANETKSLDYTLFNIGFGGKITINKMIFNCNISGNNVFDKTYISHLSRLKPEAIPNIGRNMMLAIDFEL